MPDGATELSASPGVEPLYGSDIQSMVSFLSRPDSYPEHPTGVDIIETHYSWVFLTDARAYKLKKPVRGDGFDFRIVEARQRNALAECRLNRRLAGDVYRGIIPVNLSAGGRLTIGGCGTPVDWLVKMTRLRAERMLDRRLARREWRHADIEPIARHLAAFFATARRVSMTPSQFAAQIKGELVSSLAAFGAAGEPRLLTAVKSVSRRLEAFLVYRAGLFRRRIRDGRLVDGHGDLRPEHVYVDGTPRIIDCLEFRADLRRLDPVNELAYLALECRRLGGPEIEGILLRRYRERTGDAPSPELVHFYKALNALVRARIAVRHLDEPGTHMPDQWIVRAAVYIAIATKESRLLS